MKQPAQINIKQAVIKTETLPLLNNLKIGEKNWTWEEFKKVYNEDFPKIVAELNVDMLKAYTGKSPSINQVASAFGIKSARMIIQAWITKIADFYGKGFLNNDQMEEVSILICNKYGLIKLTEMAIFFNGLKMAEYGVFYGQIDPISITKALIVFMQRRSETIEKHVRDEQNKQLAEKHTNWSQQAISLNEFLRKRNQKLEDLLPKSPSAK